MWDHKKDAEGKKQSFRCIRKGNWPRGLRRKSWKKKNNNQESAVSWLWWRKLKGIVCDKMRTQAWEGGRLNPSSSSATSSVCDLELEGLHVIICKWSPSSVPALRVPEILRTEGVRDQEERDKEKRVAINLEEKNATSKGRNQLARTEEKRMNRTSRLCKQMQVPKKHQDQREVLFGWQEKVEVVKATGQED